MSELVVIDRTPDVIAAEINSITNQTRTIVLMSSIEIGRRLVEAKSQLPHGEWGNWLEKSVDYSQSTANNMMKLFHEYGGDKIATIGNLNIESLSYTKALALLGVPAEERGEFAEKHDIDGMSARQLQQAIKEKQEAEERAKAAEANAEKERLLAEQEREKREELGKKALQNATEVERLKAELKEAQASGSAEDVERLQKSLEESENELIDARNKIKDLERKLKEKPIEASVVEEKIPDDIQAELDRLRSFEEQQKTAQTQNESIVKFKVCFESLVGGFNNLLSAYAGLDGISEEDRAKYKGAVIGLIGKMQEKIATM